uniref:inositol-phosphate phosphatase n=2 Tax=Schistocephalus solidus TaxID=70667 RepID=A0A0X3PSC5_SCHSO
MCPIRVFIDKDLLFHIRSEEHEEPSREMKKLIRSLLTTAIAMPLDRLPERDMFVQLSDVTMWVDPLDATEELKDGLLDYVSVMICGTLQGSPVLGVVHLVFSNETSWGWMPNDFSHNLQPLPVHPLSSTALRILVSRSHATADLEAAITSAFAPVVVTITRAGGAGYKIMQLLKGKADLYIHPSGARKWDLCAPIALLEAAGGVFRTMDGRRHHFLRLHPNSSIAEAGGIFAAATQALYHRWALTVRNLYRSLLRAKQST